MPSKETTEERSQRRAAVETLARFGTLVTPAVDLHRDAGHTKVQNFVATVLPLLTPAAQDDLRTAVGAWTAATNSHLDLDCDMAMPSAEEAHVAPSVGAAPGFRIHAADVQLTFNCKTWVPRGKTVAQWWASGGGDVLTKEFERWALVSLKERFSQPLVHCSLTVEESLHAADPQVHLHAQLTFQKAVDRSNTRDFAFQGIQPHLESNKARGKDVQASRARAHFYVFCNKRGSLWSYTDWQPFSDYEVNPYWLTGLSGAQHGRAFIALRDLMPASGVNGARVAKQPRRSRCAQ